MVYAQLRFKRTLEGLVLRHQYGTYIGGEVVRTQDRIEHIQRLICVVLWSMHESGSGFLSKRCMNERFES